MGSPLDDLNFGIKADITESLSSLSELGSQLDHRFSQVDHLNAAFRNLSVSNRSLGEGPKIQQQSSEMSLIDVATSAAQLTMLAKTSTTMRTVGKTMESVSRTTAVSASTMDRFRMGLAAVPVNPALNIIKHGLDAVGKGAAGAVDTIRGVVDAVLSDIPGAMSSGAGAIGLFNRALDSGSATISKHISKLHEAQGSLSLLGTVFPFAADAINRIRGPLDAVTEKAEAGANVFDQWNASVANSASDLRGNAYLLSGSFKQLGGSADLFARSQYYALLPTRMMIREVEGGMRIIRVATYAWAGLTHPIHSVSLALAKSKAEWKDLRSRIPPLTSGLQLGVRANRLFAQSAYLVGTATRAAVTVMTPVARVAVAAGRGIWSIISPAKSAATSLVKLTGVQNTFIGRAIGMKKAATDSADALTKIDKSSSLASRGFAGLSSKAGMAKTAAAGILMGMVAVGTQTAMATEKNNAIFGSMLHDMGQGTAVVKSLQATKAAKFFDNQELLDSGRLLFKAGVSATQLANKTEQFAKISAGTSTELNDLTRIYQQGANAGSFGQDKINQYAERGIAIYDGLAAATGKSGGELKKMISDGQIGIAEMDAALAHLTDGHGIYADSLNNLAGTTSGKMSEVKNNVSQALGDVMGVGLELLQPFGTAVVSMSQQLKSGFESFREPIIYASTAVAWFFGNLVNLGKFAFATFALMSVTTFNDFIYFFSDKLPAYLNWFSNNWRQVFTDAGNLIMTVFKNIGINIGSAMASIWDYIASGGTAKLQFAFVPLLDGFKATVAELPNIPDRAMTDLEKSLSAQTEQLGGQLANDFDAMLADASAQVSEAVPEIKDTATSAITAEDPKDKAGKAANRQAAENKAALVRSSEGQSVVAQFMKGFQKGDKDKRHLKAAEETAAGIKRIARTVEQGTPLKKRSFATGT